MYQVGASAIEFCHDGEGTNERTEGGLAIACRTSLALVVSHEAVSQRRGGVRVEVTGGSTPPTNIYMNLPASLWANKDL